MSIQTFFSVFLATCLFATHSVNAQTVLFSDDFNRSNNDTIGNGWTETSLGTANAQIQGNVLRLDTADNSNSPIVEHTFAAVSSGTLIFDFNMNWNRNGSENYYELWIQLGDSNSMLAPAVDNDAGIGVNLKWAGPNHGMINHEGLGSVDNGATTEAAVVSGTTDLRIVASLMTYTYDIIVDSSTVASGIPFDNNVPLNTLRIYTDGLNQSNFVQREFDDIAISEGTLFTDVSASTGFDVQSTSDVTYGSGLHWADLDDDGDLDCITTGNTARLLLSSSEGASFFVSAFNGSVRRQGALVDLDNDGDIDFWAACDNSYDAETFFDNNGSASFTDQGSAGFTDPSNNEGVAAGDVDNDGWCDIVLFSENGNWIGTNNGDSPLTLTGSDAAGDGLNDLGDVGNGDYCSSGDVNNDGYLDFFYHWSVGKLFLSDGDGSYTENISGIAVVTGNNDKVGSAFGDFDNDGDLDLFVPRYDAGGVGYLWRNDSGLFLNVTALAGIADTSSQRSACWGDYDNDGDLDLYITTTSGDNLLYANAGDGTFTQVVDNVAATGNSHDAVFVDYDNDGDLDLAVTREDDDNVLLQNALDTDQYLKVRILGAGSGGTNVAGIGTRVDLYDASGSTLLARRDVGVARGFGGTEPLWMHFGGVDAATTYIVRVHFVSGSIDTAVVPANVSTTIGAVTIDQMLTVQEPDVEPLRLIRWLEKDPNQ